MQKLTNFITSNRQLPILDEIFITDKGLVYKDLTYVTNEQKQVEYIGATARETARKQKIADTERLILIIQEQIVIHGEKSSKIKEKQKRVADTPKRTVLDNLESKNELLDKNLIRLSNDVNAVQDKLDKLNLAELTHPIFNDYSFTDLQKMYMVFNDKTSRLNKINENLENYSSEVEPKTKKIKESISEIEKYTNELAELKEKEAKLIKEIEEIEQDDYYASLLDEKQTLIDKLNQVEDEHLEVIKNQGASLSTYKTELERNNKLRKEFESKKESFGKTHEVLDEMIQKLDTFKLEKSSKVDKNILDQFNYEEALERYECTDLPKTTYSDHLKSIIGNLKYPILKNKEDNTKVTHAEQMKILEVDINAGFVTTQKMFESAKNNLTADIFPIIKRKHKAILESLQKLKEYTEDNKTAMLQFFVEYQLDDKHAHKPAAIEDIDAQNELMSDVNAKVLEFINNSKEVVETSVIEDIILAELEPSEWYDISIEYINNNAPRAVLTTKVVSKFSTGERFRAYYTPLLALYDILKSQMRQDAPFVILMDEAFDTLDEKQIKYILNSINTISDLFIVTVPKGGLPMVEKTTRIDIVQLKKQELPGGGVITYALRNNLFEEIENE
jgi:hypothetical protein